MAVQREGDDETVCERKVPTKDSIASLPPLTYWDKGHRLGKMTREPNFVTNNEIVEKKDEILAAAEIVCKMEQYDALQFIEHTYLGPAEPRILPGPSIHTS